MVIIRERYSSSSCRCWCNYNCNCNKLHVLLTTLLILLTTNVRLSIGQSSNETEAPTESDDQIIIDWDYENIVALRWAIQNPPTVDYEKLQFDIHFTVSDYIQADKHVRYDIYSSVDCGNVNYLITNNDIMETWVTEDNTTPIGMGIDPNSQRIVTVSNSLVASNITTSNSYASQGEDTADAFISYCVRFSLWNGEGPNDINSTEINHLAINITLSLDFTDEDFSINGQSVEAKERGVETTDDEFFVQAFVCNDVGQRPSDVVPLRQGELVRICIEPTEQAKEVGFRMRNIDSFAFIQDTVSQDAIQNEVAAPNFLTELTCSPGSEQCSFYTLLFANFYQNNPQSNVAGAGIATLQWGYTENRLLQQQEYLDLYNNHYNTNNINIIYEEEEEERWLQKRSSSKVIQVPIFAILAENERERYYLSSNSKKSSSSSSTRTGLIITISFFVIFGVSLILFGSFQYFRRRRQQQQQQQQQQQCGLMIDNKKIVLSEGL
jgi:hypothetical protein